MVDSLPQRQGHEALLRTGDVHDAVVISGSGVLGLWVSDLVREACARATPQVAVEQADREHHIGDIGRAEGPPRVLMVMHPGRPIMEAIAERRLPVIAVLDDPVDSVRFVKLMTSSDLLHALRIQTSAASANHLLLGNPAVAVVHRGFQGAARDIVALVVEQLGLQLASAELQALTEAFAGPAEAPWSLETALGHRVNGYARLDQLAEAITAEEALMVRQTLSPMVLGAISPDIGSITWPAKVFLSGDRPNEVAPAVADVTGGARILYYGPYFHLPPGTWKVRLIVAFSMEARDTPFRLVFFCSGQPIAIVSLRPRHGGAFEGTFMMRHRQPEQNLEIHFTNDEGSIEGHVALGQISFTRLEG